MATRTEAHRPPVLRRVLRVQPVTILSAVVALVGIAAGLVAMSLPPMEGQHDGLVAAVLVGVGFATAEVFVVHLHVRRNSHSFSLSELPLMVGLFLVSPAALLLGALGGSAAALVLHRRQRGTKLIFNLGRAAIEVTAALLVLRAICPMGGVPRNGEVLAGLGAALAYSFVGAALVSAAIATSERSWAAARFLATLPMSALGTMMAASLGLVAVIVLEITPATVWLLLVPAAGCYALYAAWTLQSRRMEGLSFLYRTAQMLQDHASVDDAIISLLAETRSLLRAHSVELVYRPSRDEDAFRARFVDGADGFVEACRASEIEPLLEIAAESSEARLVRIPDSEPMRRYLGEDETGVAIVAPLTIADDVMGALLISPPVTNVTHFSEDERRLVDTTARTLSVSFEKGSLESSLQKLRTLEERLVRQAYHDPLTRLPNRARFIERVNEVTNGGGADRDGFAVLFIDLDDFKTVNDSLGHDAGDALLVEVGKRIGSSLRPGDLAARLGGDEFAVLLHKIESRSTGEAAAERFLEALTAPLTIAGHAARVSASIGVALGSPGDDPTGLIKGADVAMYNAKAAGKSRVALFHPAMHEEMVSRYQLLQDIQVALERGELSVEFQPIVTLANGRIESVEALIRWDHAELGRIAPDVFVRLAEENRAIGDITRLVLDETCAQLRRHGRALLPRASVNVSARDLAAPDFVDIVAGTVAAHGVEPDRLTCEVTESLLLEERAVDALDALRAAGFGVALDDFGTGYSSLQVLRRLPLDEIKIAKPFIDDVELDPPAAAFVRAITTLGKIIGLNVVAEGVERPAQVDELREAGCDAAQGYLFTRPMRAEELAEYLRRPTALSTGFVSRRARPAPVGALRDAPRVASLPV
jgi:diguanylate cyclase (GGDEF)-like protein